MKTILITGASSGIGLATVKYFSKRKWRVVATVREKKKLTNEELDLNSNVTIIGDVDITKPETLKRANQEIKKKNIKIDVLLNNAGIIMIGPVETFTNDEIDVMMNVNFKGHINTIKEFLPDMRARKSGTVINITSIGGKITFPYFGYYNASKYALEAVSEALFYDLHDTGVKVKIIEPGFTNTGLVANGIRRGSIKIKDYESKMDKLSEGITENNNTKKGSNPEEISKVIFKAANDKSNRLRYSAGKLSGTLLFIKKYFPDNIFMNIIRRNVK